ncbi:MAG: internal scaffolding protein [Arizlama microvirus]|nr:MAG: internal scaffolding protein [Arizlama microvirus]
MTTKSDKQTQTPTLPLNNHKIQFRHAYSKQLRTPFINHGPAITKQEFKSECDINEIMGRYMRTGILDFVNKHQPRYEDLSNAADYQQAMLIVAESKTLFEDLPSQIRTKFENDPAKFLDFVHNPANRSEMAEMGLLRPGAATSTPPINQSPAAQPIPVVANPQATTTTTPAQTPAG